MGKIPKTSLFTFNLLLIVVIIAIVILPFYWISISSFKATPELISGRPTFYPHSFTIEHYQNLFRVSDYPIFLANSIIVALFTTLLATSLVFISGYAIYRCDFFGKRIISTFTIATYAVPTTLLIVPLYTIFVKANLINNLWSLVLINVTLTAPMGIWLLKAFFMSIPKAIEEAAVVDGAGRSRIMFQIFLPLVAPGIAAVAIFIFVTSWTEYLFSNIFILDEIKKTLPIGLARFITQYNVDWGLLMAGAVLTSLPPVLLFALFGKNFVKGLTTGAVKGD